MKIPKLSISLILRLAIFITFANGYLNIEQYCRAFDQSFRPMICILKSQSNVSVIVERPAENHYAQSETVIIKPNYLSKFKLKPKPRPRPRPFLPPRPVYVHHHHHEKNNEWEDDDDVDCSCDLDCYPVIANQNPNVTGVSYRCRSCGSSCWVRFRSLTQTNCSCAVPSGNATCTCVATCASFRSDIDLMVGLGVEDELVVSKEEDVDAIEEITKSSNSLRMGGWGGWSPSYDYEESNSDSAEDLNCIFTISNLTDTRVGLEQLPYNCGCCKSTQAQRTSDPDFVCICQRVAVGRMLDLPIFEE